jgi:dynein light intermediate chain 1
MADQNKKVNLWQEILREAMTKRGYEGANIFVFGDRISGKKSLFKLVGQYINSRGQEIKKILSINEEASKFGLIDYKYLNVRNFSEDSEDIMGKIGIWIVNDLIDKKTLQSLIKPEHILKSISVIVLDLSRPWSLKESLKKWLNFIDETFTPLLNKLELEKQNEARAKIKNIIKLYQEPQFNEANQFVKTTLTEEEKNGKLSLPLKEGVLKVNLGMPVCFVVNKSDTISQPGEKKFYEENSDFIFKHLREMAIVYGASIIYVSGKENINLNLLNDYICHLLFNFELVHKPNIIDRDSFFIPSGYDNNQLLKESDVNNYLNILYDEKIQKEAEKNIPIEDEIICEDTNLFLSKLRGDKEIVTKKGLRTMAKTPTSGILESSTKGIYDRIKNKNKANNADIEPKTHSGFKQEEKKEEKKEDEKKEENMQKDMVKPVIGDTKKNPAPVVNKSTKEAMLKKLGLKKAKK